MNDSRQRPLMLQDNFSIYLEADHPDYEMVRLGLSRFAELVKRPAHLHTYQMTAISLWNAIAMGCRSEHIFRFLREHSKWDIPRKVYDQMKVWMERYGVLRLEMKNGKLMLMSSQDHLLSNLANMISLKHFFVNPIMQNETEIDQADRGSLKQELTKLGYPIEDLAGYNCGEALSIQFLHTCGNGMLLQLRDYQKEAADAFYQKGSNLGGSGVLVVPCGAGKTMIGIAVITRLKCATLILTSNVTSVRQWRNELLDKTTISPQQIGEYGGENREVGSITIATYQILTYRQTKEDLFYHMELFQQRDWGLIIYDEVHLLPAPVFRATAYIQATRRLGLTATLIREDGLEKDVFSLIGPKRYEVPWWELEGLGWIAKVACTEVLVGQTNLEKLHYRTSPARMKMRIAGVNARKIEVVLKIIKMHSDKSILIIGQFIAQLEQLSKTLGIPLITGKTSHDQREQYFEQYKRGLLRRLIVSKVANFAVDLPDASVAIQVSGSYGSRQEEAQRIGRIMRPKPGENSAHFYTLVSRDTSEQLFAQKRQLFLIEQGYQYIQLDEDDLYSKEQVK